MKIDVTTTHLEMISADDLIAKEAPFEGVRVELVTVPNVAMNHFFFVEVGQKWRWYSRLGWSFEKWSEYINRPEVTTGLGYLGGAPFGYFELVDTSGDVELMFFGILEQFIGRRLGGYLLFEAVKHAWNQGAKRVWLHTCSQDHPSALANYKARGFKVFKTETKSEDIPDRDDPIWATPNYYQRSSAD